MSDIKLRPCPFCGADESFLTMMISARDIFFVKCCECGGASGTCETSREAADAWNRREEGEKTLKGGAE